ncbi:hypothetical protein PIB30_007756 [Stylosanthes scabra]|uniref:Disease resistance protein At4g27190-like leucine-rich repeats domain-containing protein n=1 Tax=Stylosanthes scabra TaxID=79078 RepID=A0ABU6Y3F4_9FABA|nr:hypothetical protein [Stylosanthes scabra]
MRQKAGVPSDGLATVWPSLISDPNFPRFRMNFSDVFCILSMLQPLVTSASVSRRYREAVNDKQEDESVKASLSVLGDLNQLTNLDLQIPSVEHLPKNLFFDKLYSYKIIIGALNKYLEDDFQIPEKYDLSRCLALCQKDGGFDLHSQEAIKMLFDRVEILLLQNLNGVEDVFYELNLKGFPYLKRLFIASNKSIRSLISQKRKHSDMVFPKLESLYLCKLKKIERFLSCQTLSRGSFGNLKIIKIKLCGCLKNVLLISMVEFLSALETIEISECNSLEEIVVSETNNHDETEPRDKPTVKFLELRSLTLKCLSKFIGFYPIASEGDTETLFHHKIEVPKLERVELSMLKIKHIWSEQIWTNSQSADQRISGFQKLIHKVKKNPTQPSCYPFQNLMHLNVKACWNLECLWSFTIARHLKNLQSLFVSECNMTHIFPQLQAGEAKMNKVTNCESIEVIFEEADDRKQDVLDKIKLQDIHLETLPKLENVFKWKKDVEWSDLNLNKLQKIWVHGCGRLENIFSVSVVKSPEMKIESLESLAVSDCSQLREIVCKKGEENAVINTSSPVVQFEFPKLTTVKLLKLSKFKSFYSSREYELNCPALTDLSIEGCDLLEPFEEISSHAKMKNILFPEISEKVKAGEVKAKELIITSL